MIDEINNVEKIRYIETHLQLIVDIIDQYKREKIGLNYLINQLEKIINDIKIKDEKIADALHDIWLDPYVINKIYIMRQRPEISLEEHAKINLALEDMVKYIKDLPINKN